jgi:ABC-type transport system involved in multi-copper enzyme maturation permease subunit
MSLISALPPLNPVLARELKQRMRGRHTWLVLTLYLALLAVILRWVYVAASNDTSFGGGNVLGSATIGRAIFQWLLFFMLLLVCFIVPGLTASAIAGERERQTLISLQISLLRPRSIVVGKLLASLAFVVLLVLASLPLVTIPFLLGGVSLTEVASGLVMVLATAVVLACLALACSAVLRRTQAATVVSYGVTLALVLGTLILYGAQQIPRASGAARPAPWILALNPFAATADVVQGRNPSEGFETPFRPLASLLRLNTDDRTLQSSQFGPSGSGGITVGSGGVVVPAVQGPFPVPPPPLVPAAVGPPGAVVIAPQPTGQFIVPPVGFSSTSPLEQRVELAGVPFWAVSLAAWVVLAAIAVLLAVRRISLPSARESG